MMQHTSRLISIMAELRNPKTGCPWDIEQNFSSIASYTLEEAYEVAEAIRQGDMASLKEELGDLLLQVVFHAQMAREQELFDFEAVAETICTKLLARHPHVFGDEVIKTAAEQEASWEKIKQQERAEKAATGHLDGIALALPALTRAVKLQKRAARVGFDWGDVAPVLAKIEEEIAEFKEAMTAGQKEHMQEEFGDILFAMANLARHARLDPEEALRVTNGKFERRFRYIEEQLARQGKSLEAATLAEMDALWEEAKTVGHLY